MSGREETWRAAAVLASASLAFFVTNLDASIVNIALPTLSRQFGADTSRVSRVVLLYLIALCSLLLVAGRLADARGTRRVFLWGYALFAAASLACGLAPDLPLLDAFRFLQGAGGAALYATSTSLVVKNVGAASRGRALSLLPVFGGAGFALGAPLGGFLVALLGWRWVFFINVPLGLLGGLLAAAALKRDRAGGAPAAFDVPGALLSALGVVALVFGLNQGQELGWTSLPILAAFGAFVGCSGAFVARERHCAQPLVSPGLFGSRGLLLGLLAGLCVVMVLDGMNFLFPFFFDRIRGFAPDRTGLLLGTFPLVTLLASPLAGYLADRSGARWVCSASAALLVASSLLFVFFGPRTSVTYFLCAFVLFGTALASFLAANMSLIMSHAPAGEEGATSALLSVTQSLGSVLGVSLFETVYSLGLDYGPGAEGGALAPEQLLAGFRHAGLLGVVVCAAALALSLGAREGSGGMPAPKA
jgi:EmrB/QacA subfamily drug resistance transporter